MTEQSETVGSIGLSSGHFIRSPNLPTIVSEWASLLPLVVHLAGSQDDYTTAGDISLLRQLPVSLFPPLGTFSGVARLLGKGSQYFDFASAKGGSSQTAWDVAHGCAYPVANGSASASIISFLTKKRLAEPIKCYNMNEPEFSPSTSSPSPPVERGGKEGENKNKKYRPQVLNIYDFSKGHGQRGSASNWRQQLNRLRASIYFQVLLTMVLIGLSAFLAIFGAFGAAALVLLCTGSRVVAQSITFERPATYLEYTNSSDACMLVAAHPNALEWHLFIGHSGIVSTLLNKPMILVPSNSWIPVAAIWFRLAHATQLIAMTFVAANKGWDGIFLVILMAAHYTLSWMFGRDSLASDWLEREKVEFITTTVEFSGRRPMIGAIQVMSSTNIRSWMDDILTPNPRRNYWLDILASTNADASQYAGLTEEDRKDAENDVTMVNNALGIIRKGAKNLRREMA